MRRKFGKIINELAKKDNKIVLLVGDIGYGIFDDFRKENPKRFVVIDASKDKEEIGHIIWKNINNKLLLD